MKRKYNENNKEQAILLLKAAVERKLVEQDTYRVRIEQALAQKSTNAEKQQLVDGGSEELLNIMKGCVFPPTDNDRKDHLNINWDETLHNAKTSQIKDGGVRCCVNHLMRISEHTQRLEAMAVFSEKIWPLDADGERLFNYWSMYSMFEKLLEEADELELVVAKEKITAWRKAIPFFIEIYSSKDRDQIATNISEQLKHLDENKE